MQNRKMLGRSRSKRVLRAACTIVCLAVAEALITPATGGATPGTSAIDKALGTPFFGDLPPIFEVNRGQTDSRVKFLSRGNGYILFLTRDAAVLALLPLGEQHFHPRVAPWMGLREALHHKIKRAEQEEVLRIKLVGADPHASIEGVSPLPGKANYFIGNDPRKWVTDVATYAKVRYRNTYPGIDLVYYESVKNRLEYDFILSPKANPDVIKLRFGGAKSLTLNRNGDVVATLADGTTIIQHLPVIYQERNGGRERIHGRCVLLNRNTIGFAIAAYDHTRAVSIDPALVIDYSTYLGGRNGASAYAIAVDSAGNVYVTGTAMSRNFPTKGAFQNSPSGRQNAFVAKLNPSVSGAASLVYSTYFGGHSHDAGQGIAVDSKGNVYVTGWTLSGNFPTKNAFQSRCPCFTGGGGFGCSAAFVAKFKPSASGRASLLYSTYLGGNGVLNGGGDAGMAIAVDSAGNAYVTGSTTSTNFPVTPNAYQTTRGGTFISKIDPSASGDASLLYSTYLDAGGGLGIAVNSAGDLYVTGWAEPSELTTTPNAFQSNGNTGKFFHRHAFMAMLDPSVSGAGALLYATYLAGNYRDSGTGIAVDATDDAYVTGWTESSDFPTTSNAYQTTAVGTQGGASVAKLDPSAWGAASLLYSTYLTGSRGAVSNGIAVDPAGNAYVTGETGSPDFPTKDALLSGCLANGAFVAKLNPSVSGEDSLIWPTYVGQTDNAGATRIHGEGSFGIALDSAGDAYVAGGTSASDFPTMNALRAKNPLGWNLAFVTKLSLAAVPETPLLIARPSTLKFGSVFVTANSNPKTMHLVNTGAQPALIGQITASPPWTIISRKDACSHRSIEPKKKCSLEVAFSPPTPGKVTGGSLTVPYCGPQPAMDLHGYGAPVRLKAPHKVTFSPVPANSKGRAKIIRVSNRTPLVVDIFDNVTLGGANPGSFSLTGTNTCTHVQLTTCKFGVRFAPPSGASGEQSATVGFGYTYFSRGGTDFYGGTLSIQLFGTVKQ